MVWVILTLSKIEALLAFSRAHFGHDYDADFHIYHQPPEVRVGSQFAEKPVVDFAAPQEVNHFIGQMEGDAEDRDPQCGQHMLPHTSETGRKAFSH